MPDSKSGGKHSIRSMTDAVNELRDFAGGENAGESRGEDASPKDASPKKRVYGDESKHRAERAEKTPRRKKKKRAKKRPGLLHRLLRTGKRIRRGDEERQLTFFGHRLSFWPMFLAVFAVLMVLVFLLNSTNLVTDQQNVTLMGLPADLENYRILVLSDLNGKRFGDRQSTLLRQIDTLNYDIVICLGDMVGKGGDAEPFYELLEGLPASKKVYFICGDSDPGPYVDAVREESAPLSQLVLADWILGAIDRGATYVDRPIALTVGASTLWLTPSEMLNVDAYASSNLWKEQMSQEESGYLAGVVADKNTLPFTSYRYQLAMEQLDSVNAMNDADVHITLSHVPCSDRFLTAACGHSPTEGKYLSAPDIALAGHYCGGVWNLPLLGAFYVPDSSLPRYGWFPDQSVVSGLRQIDEVQQYVSRGLSNCGDIPLMPFRLLNSPQVSVITITATLPSSMLE